MFRITSFLLALGWLFTAMPLCAQTLSPLQTARQWLAAEQYDSAALCFRRCRAAAAPDSAAAAAVGLAYCYTDCGNYPPALLLLHQTLRTASLSNLARADVLTTLGFAYWRKSYSDSALYWLRQAEPLCPQADTPRQFRLALYMGMAHQQKEDLPPTRDALRRAEALSAKASAYEHARLYAHLGSMYSSLGWEKSKCIATRKMLDWLPRIPHQAVRWGHILLEGSGLIERPHTADSLAHRLDSIYTLRLGAESIGKAHALGWLAKFAESDSMELEMLERVGRIYARHLTVASSQYIGNRYSLAIKYNSMGRTKDGQAIIQEARQILAHIPPAIQEVYYPVLWLYEGTFWQTVAINRDSALLMYQQARTWLAKRAGEYSIAGTATTLLEAGLQDVRGDTTTALNLLNMRREAIMVQAGDTSSLMLAYYQGLAEHHSKLNQHDKAHEAWERVDQLAAKTYGRYSTKRCNPLFNRAFSRPIVQYKRYAASVLHEFEQVVHHADDLTEREQETKRREVFKYLAFVYLILNMTDSSDFYLDKWVGLLDTRSRDYPHELSHLSSITQLRGDWAGYERRLELAKIQFEKNIQNGVRNLQTEGFFLDEMGDYYCKKGMCDSAQTCYSRYRSAAIQMNGLNDVASNSGFLENELNLAKCTGLSPYSLIRLKERILAYHRQHNAQDLDRILGAINGLANEYRFIGDMSRFRLLDAQALQIQDSLAHRFPDDAVYQANYWFHKGSTHRFAGVYDTAIYYYRKALDIAQKHRLSDRGYYTNIGIAFSYKKAFAQAAQAFQDELDILPNDNNPDHLNQRMRAKSWLGYMHNRLNQTEKTKGLAEYLLTRVDSIVGDHDSATEYCFDAAFFLRKQKQYEASVAAAQKGLDIAGATQVGGKFRALRVVGKSSQLPLGYDHLTQTYRRWYEATHDRALLDSAALYARYAVEAQEAQENSTGRSDPEVRMAMREKAGDYYFEEAIRSELEYAALDHDPARREQAFHLCERSKAVVFRQMVQQQQSAVPKDIAPDLLAAEQHIARQIRALEVLRFQMQQNAAAAHNTAWHDDLAPRLVRLYEQRDSVGRIMEQHYPDYYALRYDSRKLATVRDLQRRVLEPGQTLVEYFLTDSLLAIFVVRPDTFSIYTTKPDSALSGQMDIFLREVRQPDPQNQLYGSSRYLYQQLLEPVERLLTRELIIVPAGRLHLLPFEALLTDNQPNAWLIRCHSVRHGVSSTVLAQTMNRSDLRPARSERRLVAFAPNYAGLEDNPEVQAWGFEPIPDTRGGIRALKGNRVEIEDVAREIGPDVPLKVLRTSLEATRDQFEQDGEGAWLLHFAGHAKSYDRAGQYSFLVFAHRQGPFDRLRLFARDVYGLRLRHTEMVTLSGCETGLGQVQTGEGVIGLGRAFAYSGARSLSFSLWSVSDNAASRMMPDFYQYLRQGQPKHEALRQAKLNLLQRGLPPFFWAPFVLYGDGRAIFSP